MTELRTLTSVRGIAAWLVVLYHIRLSIAGLPTGVLAVVAKGYLAVDFFFLLSGFVIWLRWGARLRDGGWPVRAMFLQRRIARIWPLHLVMLGFAVALAIVLAATGRADGYAFSFGELPLHLLLVQSWWLTPHLSWNDPAWSISAELAAYLLFPLLMLAVDWRRVPTAALVLVGGALAIGLFLAMRGHDSLGDDVSRFGVVRCLFEFAGGTIVAALWVRGAGSARVTGGLALALLGAGLAGLPEPLVVPAAFACALLALVRVSGRRGNPLDRAIPHWFGEVSYATYLSHFLLWRAFKLAFVRDVHAVPPVLILAYLAIVLATSALLYTYVEQPAQRRINALRWTRREEGVVTPSRP
jgi:peptidoglycan/LPS O-acetylase OafA/YrhL